MIAVASGILTSYRFPVPSFKFPYFCCCLGLFFQFGDKAWSQGGSLDPSFGSAIIPNNYVDAMAEQNDGKIVLIGSFTSLGVAPASYIARVNPNGTMDDTFNPGSGPNQAVRCLALQGDGKILISGYFTTVGGQSRSGLARLNSNGSVDTSFNAGTSVSGPSIKTIEVQTDGKVLVGGQFHAFNGDSTKANFVRLNADGTVDPAFSAYTGLNGQVTSLLVQEDSKIVVAGSFTTVNGTPRKYVARLNPNGALDTGFEAGTGPSSGISKVMLQSDGKLLVQGDFTGTTAAGSRPGYYRLNANGTLDPTFNLDPGFGSSPQNVALGPDDRAVLAGDVIMADGINRRVVRLETSGSVDPLFDTGKLIPAAANPGFNSILIQTDGKVVLAPSGKSMFRLVSSGALPPQGVPPVLSALTDGQGVRLMWSDVTHEEGYKIERSPDGAGSWLEVATLTSTRNRRIYDGDLVSGATYHYRVRAFNRFGDGAVSETLAAQVKNGVWPGQVDLSLDPAPAGIVSGVARSVTQPDGKLIVVARYQAHLYSSVRTVIARLNADGSVERFFDAVSDYSEVYSLLLQPDGKLVAGGSFKVANGTIQRSIARFNVDGTEDVGFNTFVVSRYGLGSIRTMARQADGKLVIGGYFNQVNQTASGHVARLNADGSVDTSFNTGTGANGSVTTLALDSIGRVVIGGDFNQVNGMSCGRVARLLSSGSLDPSFNANPGSNGTLRSLAVQADDRVLIAGDFNSYNSTTCNRVARLHADGSLDAGFNVPVGPNQITAMFLQPDGKSIITGNFDRIGDTARRNVARLTTTGDLDPGFDPVGNISLTSINAYSEGRIVGAGDVTFPDGTPQMGLVRLAITGGSPPPPKPLGLTVAAVDASRLRLTWTDVPGETTYFIERSPDGANGWIQVGQAPADAPTFTDSELTQNTRYFYRVRSSNLQGASLPSDTGDAYTMQMPVAPTQFEVQSYDGSQTILSWKSTGYTTGFVIERSTTGTGDWVFVATVSLYEDLYKDSDLIAETQYFYRVRALNNGGDSATTGAVGTTTAAQGWVPAGSVDPTFTTGLGFTRTPGNLDGLEVRKILLQSDGKLIVCGSFGSYGGFVRKNIARLNPDGSIDPSFDPGAWESSDVQSAALQSDGKIVVGGNFTGLDGYTRTDIVRLNPNGSMDTSFNATAVINSVQYSTFSYGLRSLAVQADGKVIAGGSSLIRLNSDGTKDAGFTAAVTGSGFTPNVGHIVMIPNGQFMISGIFTAINGATRRDLARLNTNGSVDTGFDAGFQYSNGDIFSPGLAIAIQPDGKVLRANPRYSIQGGIDRFNSNGTLDAGFTPPLLVFESVYAGLVHGLAVQTDGRIVVVGQFSSIAGFRRSGIARLNADGTLDGTFNSGLGLPGGALSVVIQGDGRILLGGGFTAVDGQPRSHVARLLGDPVSWDSLQQWKLGFGLSPTASDSNDLDLDGMPGLLEYALGGNPLVADPEILPSGLVTPGALTLSYVKLRQDVSYAVETSLDLVNWTMDNVDQGGSQTNATATVSRGGSPQKFLRLRVRRP